MNAIQAISAPPDDWGSPTNLIAIGALILSLVAIVLPFIREWWANKQISPDVICTIERDPLAYGLLKIIIRFSNRTIEEWHIKQMDLPEMKGARAIEGSAAVKYDPNYGTAKLDPSKIEPLSRPLPLSLQVCLAPTDRTSDQMFHQVRLGPKADAKISVFVLLAAELSRNVVDVVFLAETYGLKPRRRRLRLACRVPPA